MNKQEPAISRSDEASLMDGKLARVPGASMQLALGAGLTVLILAACYLHVLSKASAPVFVGSWDGARAFLEVLRQERLADFGQWLSGVAGTLAFVWLVIAYLQQGRELRLQAEEMRVLASANMGQLRAMMTESFFARIQLEATTSSSILGVLAMREWGNAMATYIGRLGGGSPDIHFSFFAACVGRSELTRMAGDQAVRRQLSHICDVFEGILSEADVIDAAFQDGAAQSQRRFRHTVERGAWAGAYWTACRTLGREPRLVKTLTEADVRLPL